MNLIAQLHHRAAARLGSSVIVIAFCGDGLAHTYEKMPTGADSQNCRYSSLGCCSPHPNLHQGILRAFFSMHMTVKLVDANMNRHPLQEL